MNLCCGVNPMYWCYPCQKQFCKDCLDAAQNNLHDREHSHVESGEWDFYPNRDLRRKE